jgi:predicted esterase
MLKKYLNFCKIKSIKKINSNFYNFPSKGFFDVKSLKWYWREKNYDMFHDEIYKNYLIQRREVENKNSPHVELIPYSGDKTKYDSCLIWLYDGDWLEMFIEQLLEFNNFPPKNYKIIFFRAPVNPIEFDTSVFQRSWFNIFDLPDASGYRDINKKEIDKFTKDIHREIKDQYNLIGNYNNIIIGGFSQSACMALYSTMTYEKNLGGCISLSGFNFNFTPLDMEKKTIPILSINGIKDEVVLIKHARNSYANLTNLGFNIKFIEEPGLYHFFTKTGLHHSNNLLLNKHHINE